MKGLLGIIFETNKHFLTNIKTINVRLFEIECIHVDYSQET